MPSLVRLIRLFSWVICLIVVAYFVTFAVTETSSASSRQQTELRTGVSQAGVPTHPAGAAPAHVGTVHKAIDEATAKLTSPFSGITSGSSSQWTIHIVNTVMALVIYGFGLGFLARLMRVRV